MKVVKILYNRVIKIPARRLTLKLACGHKQKLTQIGPGMRLPTHTTCRECRGGWWNRK